MTTLTKTVNRSSKDVLARLMATENIRVQHSAQMSTAAMDVVNRVLYLPVWEDMSDALYDMLVTHEVGHALFTPADWDITENACKRIAGDNKRGQAIAKQFLNIIEDGRIERMMKDKFPGAKRSFYTAYKDLWNRDFFKVNGKNFDEMNLADKINLHFKGQILGLVQIEFDVDEQVFIDRITTSKTFDDVIDIAVDLYQYMIDNDETISPEDVPQSIMDLLQKDGEENEESENQNSLSAGEATQSASNETGQGTADGASASDETGTTQGSGNGKSGEDCGQSMTDNTDDGSSADSQQGSGASTPQQSGSESGTQDTAGGETEGCVPEGSETERSFADSIKSLNSEDAQDHNYYDIPKLNLDNIIADYSDVWERMETTRETPEFNGPAVLKNFERQNRSVVNNMAKQFELKKAADADHRTLTSKTGKLDMSRIFQYRYNEDIFLRSEVTPDGKNHGMVMFVDWSGSMCDCITNTIEQVVTLSLFCKKVNIPFEVYAFSSSWKWENPYNNNNVDNQHSWGRSDRWRSMCDDYVITRADADDDNQYGVKKGDITDTDTGDFLDVRQFTLMNLLSSRMNRKDWKIGAENLLVIAHEYGRKHTYGQKRIQIPNTFNLGGTPLNEAILAASQIVPAFRKGNNLQVCNTVFLTDGEASSMSGGYGVNVVRNTKTRVESSTADCTNGRRHGMTECLLNYFRKTSGGRAIGMFLASAKGKKQFERLAHGFLPFNDVYDQLDTLYDSWKKNHFFTADKGGYDEYFIVNSQQATENLDLDALSDDVSFTKLKNTFSKGMTQQSMSRILLNRFVEMVATDLS